MKEDKEMETKDFSVITYYAGWNGDQTEKLDLDILTHVIYAFAIPKKNGTMRRLKHQRLVKKIVRMVHDKNRTISLAIGGWSYHDIPLESTFAEATNSPEKIKMLGDQIVAMCMKFGFDGIDVDWEHPRISGTYKQYEDLILYLEKELHQRGKILTSAVFSGVNWDGSIHEDSAAHTDKVLQAVDWLNVMTYDGGEKEKHSTYEFAVNCMNYWINTRGLSKEKVMMGLPFYSYNPAMDYKKILRADPQAYSKDMTIINNKEYHYNGIITIQKKTEYAMEHCGGVMIWEITNDTEDKNYSLLQSIGKVKKSADKH